MTWETYLEEQQLRYQDELLQFLSIPSISALPEHAGDVQRTIPQYSQHFGTA